MKKMLNIFTVLIIMYAIISLVDCVLFLANINIANFTNLMFDAFLACVFAYIRSNIKEELEA